ncbi:Uu.00g081130.m01.CDS01 [Anthostomella pinea]|uniref:Uu.00g081130.m01.CDS01 n=1 Tax=Anthostomella pinea TaxID=933095 RepID=A0AAI8VLT1_9PEZI|nr:Uu.00g081130.m01.CDS01 [Anthostomella pinea]
MAPSPETLQEIANQAERDLNSYEAKTGANKTSPSDEAGVDSRVENKFPGAEVKYGSDLSTNASYNKRIPPEEGGEVDARGRQTRGEHFEGNGGPEDKLRQQEYDYGGHNTLDATGKRQHDIGSMSATDPTVPFSSGGDAMPEGKAAVESNIAGTTYAPRKNQFKGSDYYDPETVPGSISAEGNEAPGSVTQASREAEYPS